MPPDAAATRGLFVTGGTSGIGLAIALRLARHPRASRSRPQASRATGPVAIGGVPQTREGLSPIVR